MIHLWNITSQAWRLWNEGKGLELMDPILEESCVTSEIMKCVYISLLCVQEDPADRPAMSSVLHMLGSNSISFIQPRKPAYYEGQLGVALDCSAKTLNHSINEVTISSLSAR